MDVIYGRPHTQNARKKHVRLYKIWPNLLAKKNRTKNQSQEIEKSVKDKSKQKTIFNVLHTTVTY